jgi:hypothetical protein
MKQGERLGGVKAAIARRWLAMLFVLWIAGDLPPTTIPAAKLTKSGVEGYCVVALLWAVPCGELGRWNATTTAVRLDLVVVAPPLADHVAGLSQRREPKCSLRHSSRNLPLKLSM